MNSYWHESTGMNSTGGGRAADFSLVDVLYVIPGGGPGIAPSWSYGHGQMTGDRETVESGMSGASLTDPALEARIILQY